MSDTPKKQTFLHGTMLLAMSTAIVKLIGALYSIPLRDIIGDEGFGFYSTAYEIYTVLLMISTAGLPVAMSRMISQANSLGNYRQVRKIYTISRRMLMSKKRILPKSEDKLLCFLQMTQRQERREQI